MHEDDKLIEFLKEDPNPDDGRWQSNLVDTLRDLAGFWLTNEIFQSELRTVRRKVGERRPKLEDAPGFCHVLIVPLTPRLRSFMGAGGVIPLQWREASEHDSRLPEGLVDVAGRMKSVVAEEIQRQRRKGRDTGAQDGDVTAKIQRLHVGFPEQGKWPDLRGFDSEFNQFESACGTLALGLIGRLLGERIKQDAWVSVAWDEGPKNVSHLADKIRVAQRFQFESMWSTEDSFNDECCELLGNAQKRSPDPSPSLMLAFKEILVENLIDPIQNRPWRAVAENDDLCRQAYNHFKALHRVDLPAGSKWYRDNLVPIVGWECYQRVLKSAGRDGTESDRDVLSPDSGMPIVCIAAFRGDTERITLATWRPPQMVLLTDEQDSQSKRRIGLIKQFAEELGIEGFQVDGVPMPHRADEDQHRSTNSSERKFVEEMTTTMLESCERLRQQGNGEIIYDASGGTATMKSVMFCSVLRPGDFVVVLDSVREDPGSERYHIFRFQPPASGHS